MVYYFWVWTPPPPISLCHWDHSSEWQGSRTLSALAQWHCDNVFCTIGFPHVTHKHDARTYCARNLFKFCCKIHCFLGKECTTTCYILHIILNKFANLQLSAKNNEFVAKIANMRIMKILWPFLRWPKGCQLLPDLNTK